MTKLVNVIAVWVLIFLAVLTIVFVFLKLWSGDFLKIDAFRGSNKRVQNLLDKEIWFTVGVTPKVTEKPDWNHSFRKICQNYLAKNTESPQVVAVNLYTLIKDTESETNPNAAIRADSAKIIEKTLQIKLQPFFNDEHTVNQVVADIGLSQVQVLTVDALIPVYWPGFCETIIKKSSKTVSTVESLGGVLQPPIPLQNVELIKNWKNHYPDMTLFAAMVKYVKTHKKMTTLLKDNETKPRIPPLVSGPFDLEQIELHCPTLMNSCLTFLTHTKDIFQPGLNLINKLENVIRGQEEDNPDVASLMLAVLSEHQKQNLEVDETEIQKLKEIYGKPVNLALLLNIGISRVKFRNTQKQPSSEESVSETVELKYDGDDSIPWIEVCSQVKQLKQKSVDTYFPDVLYRKLQVKPVSKDNVNAVENWLSYMLQNGVNSLERLMILYLSSSILY